MIESIVSSTCTPTLRAPCTAISDAAGSVRCFWSERRAYTAQLARCGRFTREARRRRRRCGSSGFGECVATPLRRCGACRRRRFGDDSAEHRAVGIGRPPVLSTTQHVPCWILTDEGEGMVDCEPLIVATSVGRDCARVSPRRTRPRYRFAHARNRWAICPRRTVDGARSSCSISRASTGQRPASSTPWGRPTQVDHQLSGHSVIRSTSTSAASTRAAALRTRRCDRHRSHLTRRTESEPARRRASRNDPSHHERRCVRPPRRPDVGHHDRAPAPHGRFLRTDADACESVKAAHEEGAEVGEEEVAGNRLIGKLVGAVFVHDEEPVRGDPRSPLRTGVMIGRDRRCGRPKRREMPTASMPT